MSFYSADTMFPETLDGARVLLYTPQDNYGAIKYPNGEIAGDYRYLAICKYSNDEQYCLFCCNAHYEVVSDSCWDSIEQCMSVADASYKANIVWHQTE